MLKNFFGLLGGIPLSTPRLRAESRESVDQPIRIGIASSIREDDQCGQNDRRGARKMAIERPMCTVMETASYRREE